MTYIENVQPEAKSPHESGPLDRERGRTHDRSQLRLHLADGPGEYLTGALDNPELGPDEVAILLRNRAGTAEVVARVARNRTWMRVRAVQLALVSHLRAPQIVARRFLPHLTWRDLVDVSANARLSPVLRREAERLLATRIPELALGERVVVARRGSRGVVALLRLETDALVLRALAENAKATEGDLTDVLSRSDLPGEFLGWLASRSSWCRRRAVRLALVRHPRTPPAVSLRLTRELSDRDIDDLRRDSAAPRLVRVAAERLLATADAGPDSSRDPFG